LQGYGKHTKEELYEIGFSDLKSLETFLANKNYLFGAKPTVEDAVIFSFTTQIAYHDNGPLNEFFFSKKFFKKIIFFINSFIILLSSMP
jgi:hypothetical protein